MGNRDYLVRLVLGHDNSCVLAHHVYADSGDVENFPVLVLGAQRAQSARLGLKDRPGGFDGDRLGHGTDLKFGVDRESFGQVQRDFSRRQPEALAENCDSAGP